VEAEGGCGVTGFAAGVPVSGRHIFAPSMVGLDPEALGVTPEILEEDYLLQIAYLDPEVRLAVEERFITYGHKGQRFLGCGLGPSRSMAVREIIWPPGLMGWPSMSMAMLRISWDRL